MKKAIAALRESMAMDPVRHCRVYKMAGCAHVDGPLCDMRTCQITVNVAVHPISLEVLGRENDHKR